jgi:response regulator RpfG family c-di-GMP phosphodiesterase
VRKRLIEFKDLLWMPVLSDDQVLRTLRRNPETKSLPVIVISASREGERIAQKAGADLFLAKPFRLENPGEQSTGINCRVKKTLNLVTDILTS